MSLAVSSASIQPIHGGSLKNWRREIALSTIKSTNKFPLQIGSPRRTSLPRSQGSLNVACDPVTAALQSKSYVVQRSISGLPAFVCFGFIDFTLLHHFTMSNTNESFGIVFQSVKLEACLAWTLFCNQVHIGTQACESQACIGFLLPRIHGIQCKVNKVTNHQNTRADKPFTS